MRKNPRLKAAIHNQWLRGGEIGRQPLGCLKTLRDHAVQIQTLLREFFCISSREGSSIMQVPQEAGKKNTPPETLESTQTVAGHTRIMETHKSWKTVVADNTKEKSKANVPNVKVNHTNGRAMKLCAFVRS